MWTVKMIGKPELIMTLKGHRSAVNSVSWSPDGTKIVSSSGGVIRVWDSQTGGELVKLEGEFVLVSWNSSGDKFVSCGGEGSARVWNNSGKPLYTIVLDHWVTSVSWGGDRIAFASGSKKLFLWHTSTRNRFVIPLEKIARDVSFSPDNKSLAFGCGKSVNIYNAGLEMETLGKHSGDVMSVSWSPDGTKIVSGAEDDTIRVWDSHGGELAKLEGHTMDVQSVSFFNECIVSGSWDGTVRVWDVSGRLLHTLTVGSPVECVSCYDDKFVTGTMDGTLQLWRAPIEEDEYEPIATLRF